METKSNYDQYLTMLSEHPKIKVLSPSEAHVVLKEIIQKYQNLGITDIHYLWTHGEQIPMRTTEMQSIRIAHILRNSSA